MMMSGQCDVNKMRMNNMTSHHLIWKTVTQTEVYQLMRKKMKMLSLITWTYLKKDSLKLQTRWRTYFTDRYQRRHKAVASLEDCLLSDVNGELLSFYMKIKFQASAE